jgi:hypothetical protein
MKRIILVLGVIASTGLTFSYAPYAKASNGETSLHTPDAVNLMKINYVGKDEDGKKEDIKTGKPKS